MALPTTIDVTLPNGAVEQVANLDNRIREFKQQMVDILGLPLTAISEATISISADGKLSVLETPTDPAHAVRKDYVDARQTGTRFTIQGTAAIAAKVIQALIEKGATFKKVWLYSDVAPTGGDLVVDINKNGVTIFTNQANRPRILAGANSGFTETFGVTTIAPGDRLSVDIDQVGPTIAGGNDLLVTVEYT